MSKKEAKRAKKRENTEQAEAARSQKAAARTPRGGGAAASAEGPNASNSRSARRKAAKRARRREHKQLSTPAAAPPVSSIAAILAAAAASPSKASPLAAAATNVGGSSSSDSSDSSSGSDQDDANRGKPAAAPLASSAACEVETWPAAKPAGVVGTWVAAQRSRRSVPAAPAAVPAARSRDKSWKELWRLDASVAEAGTPLHGKPVVGTVLAYRVVELTAAMMPQMTELRQGVVVAYDDAADMCTLQLWPAAVQGALQRAQREADRRAQANPGQEQRGEEEWWNEEEEEEELPCEPYLSDGTLVTPLQELMDVRVLHAAPGTAGAAGGGTSAANGTTGQAVPVAPAQGNASGHAAQSSPAVGGLRVPPTLQRLRGDAWKRAGEANATDDVLAADPADGPAAAAATTSSVDHWTDMAAALKAKKEKLLQGMEADGGVATTPGIQTRRMAATVHSKTVVGRRTPRSGGIGGILARVRREAEQGEATAQ